MEGAWSFEALLQELNRLMAVNPRPDDQINNLRQMMADLRLGNPPAEPPIRNNFNIENILEQGQPSSLISIFRLVMEQAQQHSMMMRMMPSGMFEQSHILQWINQAMAAHQMEQLISAQRSAEIPAHNQRCEFKAKLPPMNVNNSVEAENLKKYIKLGYDQQTAGDRSDYTIAFVWDLDDITMLSRMRQIAAQRPDIDAMSLKGLVDRVLMSVDVSDPDEINGTTVVNIEDEILSHNFHASKYYYLHNLYTAVSNEMKNDESIISHELLDRCGILREKEHLNQIASKVQDIQYQRWQWVKKSLDLVNTTPFIANVVLTGRGVAQAAAELLVSGMAPSIPIENIYSWLRMSKSLAWRKMQQRFGEKCRLIYITSNMDYCPKDVKLSKLGVQMCLVNYQGPIDYIYDAQKEALR